MFKVLNFKISKKFIINSITILFLLYLPYYIFGGKMYLGGDDTRLFYSYPLEFLKNITFFSWYKVSSIGINGPSQYLAPFLLAWSLLGFFFSKVVLNHLAFSLPLIMGFIYFQKAVRELFSLDSKNDIELYLGSLFYIFSPILVLDQMFIFLISIWLIGLIPLIGYFFIKFLKTGEFKYVYIAMVSCIMFALAIYAVPWLSGFVLPLVLGLLCTSFLFKKKEILFFLKNSIIFFGFILLSQAFWLYGFLSTFFSLGQESFASKFVSKGFVDTFTPTILSTATSSIIYPLLNLFLRQIAFDFEWKLKDVFLGFYDKTFFLNSIYIVILVFGILNYRKHLNSFNKKLFLLFSMSFLFSLYFFTVNIGPLRELFIRFGMIPGFTMFRNFYDKFAPGYVILYAIVISISLVMVTKKFVKKRAIILLIFLLVTILNFIPVKATVNSPLWTTKDMGKAITIPEEYLDFMKYVKEHVSSSTNILSLPFGSSAYTVIKDENSNNVYAGVSPVKIFSGINDISGHLSFNFTPIADVVDGLIINKNYSELNKILFEHNINYVLITKNVPKQLITSYLYNPNLYLAQDQNFINAIVGNKIATSSEGNYDLYQARQMNSVIDSKNVYFQKLSEVKYMIYVKHLAEPRELSFIDSFHPGWRLYLQKNPSLSFCKDQMSNSLTGSIECKAGRELFKLSDLNYIWQKTVFGNSHGLKYSNANRWTIDPQTIKNNYNKKYFTLNNDGTIDIELVLYFQPQENFYIGTAVTIIVMIGGGVYMVYLLRKRKNK